MKTGQLQIKGWPVPVFILDKREVFGRVEYLCKPRNGAKKATWKNSDAVTVDAGQKENAK